MKNTYCFILDETGKRQATYLLGIHGKTVKALHDKAEKEYPGAPLLDGGDDYFNQFAQGKIYVDGQFVDPAPYVPPLDEVKAAKVAELKSIRNTKELEPVMYNGHRFDFDKDSIDRLNAATITMSTKKIPIINWTSADHEEIPMTMEDLQGVIAAGGMRSNELHGTYRNLKEAVQAATTNEEVKSINWTED